MQSRAQYLAGVASVLLAATTPARSQVTDSPVKTLVPAPDLKPFGDLPANAPPPSADPRDFTGVYIAGPRPPGGPPRPAGPPRAGAAPAAPPGISLYQRCIPPLAIGSSGYVDMIVQTPARLTFIGESNNYTRRVYIDEKFPDKIEPSYEGYSIGHWDGDTLVIETRGLKINSLAPDLASITRVVERVRKLDGGKLIEDAATIEGLDAEGKVASRTRTGLLAWRSDLHVMEFNCEDGAELFFTK